MNVILLLISNELIPKNYFFESDIIDKFTRLLIINMIAFYIYYFYDYKHDRVLFKQKEIGKKE